MGPSWKVSFMASHLSCANKYRTLRDDEFNIVLVKLVECLGHSNPIVSGVAFTEVR